MPNLEPSTQILAPAKINLALHVVGQRTDGYHLIETLCVFAEDGDRLVVSDSARDEFEICGPFANAVPASGHNLVMAARDALRTSFAEEAAGPVAIRLEKNVPVAAGLGGGSSDAAAALILLSRHWQLELDNGTLAKTGLPIGADIPMCVHAVPLIARGVGEAIETIADFPSLAMVLVNPGVPVPTGDIFAGLKSKQNPPLPALPCDLTVTSLIDWLSSTRNDLQPPAGSLVPEIAESLHALEGSGAVSARMTGSGATCFGIFRSMDEALAAERIIASDYPQWFVKAVETGASR
ncbi:MAG: 4-(cytidine 5'-diphospho)-2-C-methyl-D-erythritol kinase [Rhizobiaceae bacterium]